MTILESDILVIVHDQVIPAKTYIMNILSVR